jgi:serine/threonine-protein kinase HipA
MSPAPDELLVHVDDECLGPDAVAGRLRRVEARGNYVVSFSYDAGFLPRARKPILDPTLGLYDGDQYPPAGPLFGMFADAAPDRWGRYLLQRRETQLARKEQRRGRQLDDWDYLVGVSDDLRMGALRLQVLGAQQFVSSHPVSVPPVARLRALESLSVRAERGDELSDDEASTEFRLLIEPGASLGGARPKANVRGPDNALWIAKFASYNDDYDKGACEYILTKLGALAGVATPPIQQERLGRFTTFMSNRFDRTPSGRRHLPLR